MEKCRRLLFWTLFISLCALALAWALRCYGAAESIPNLSIFYALISRHDAVAAIPFVAILFLAPFFPQRRMKAVIEELSRPSRTFWCLLFLTLSLFSLFIYQNYPLSRDEQMLIFQSEIFSRGRLTGQWPHHLVRYLVPPGHHIFTIASQSDGRCMSAYWPSFSALLTPFTALSLRWLLNPLICVLSLLLLQYFIRVLLPENKEAPGWVLFLSLASPQLVVMSFSFYSMTAHLFFNLLFAILLFEPKPQRLFCAGLAGGFAMCLHNPFPHLVFALPLIIWLMGQGKFFGRLAALVFGYAITFSIFGGTYLWLKSTIMGPGSASLMSLLSVIKGMNVDMLWIRLLCLLKLWLWAAPGLIVLFFFSLRETWQQSYLRALLLSGALILFSSLFHHGSQGHGWGYRHFHYCWFLLPLFAAWTLSRHGKELKSLSFSLCLLSILVLLPLRCYQVRTFISEFRASIPPINRNDSQIVFIRPFKGYMADHIYNSPFLENKTIFLTGLNEPVERAIIEHYFPAAKFRKRFADGTIWTLPTVTKLAIEP